MPLGATAGGKTRDGAYRFNEKSASCSTSEFFAIPTPTPVPYTCFPSRIHYFPRRCTQEDKAQSPRAENQEDAEWEAPTPPRAHIDYETARVRADGLVAYSPVYMRSEEVPVGQLVVEAEEDEQDIAQMRARVQSVDGQVGFPPRPIPPRPDTGEASEDI